MSGKIFQQKTLNNTFSFSKLKKELTSNSPFEDIQDINLTSQSKEQNLIKNEQNIVNQNFDRQDIQIKDKQLIVNQSQTQRIPQNKILKEQKKQKQQYNSQEKQFNKQQYQLIQQSQTIKQQAFDNEQQTKNLQNNNKRQIILLRMEEEKVEKDRIAQQQQEANKIIKKIQERIKLQASQLKQKEDDLILVELEKRKAFMAQKRELSQPVRLNDLNDHQKKYEEHKKIREYQREHQKLDHDIKIKQNTQNFPKTQTQMKLEEEEKQHKQLKEQDIQFQKSIRQRQFKYADFVQENYFREHPIKQKQSPPPKDQQSKQIKEQNIKKIPRYISNIPQQHNLSQESKNSNNDRSIHLENKPPQSIKKTIQQVQDKTSKVPQQTVKYDYLQQFKQQRKMQNITLDQINKSNESISYENQQDIQKVLDNILKLEQKAKEKEKLALLNNDIQIEEEANNLYIATIKAKLAILDIN